MKSIHISVLPQETLHWLDPKPGQILVDGTMGGAGHTRMLAKAVGLAGKVIAVDLDPDAIERLHDDDSTLSIQVINGNFCNIPELLNELGIEKVDGVLLDLGLSSDQLEDNERGFSYRADGPLDLRFNFQRGEPAWKLLERISEKHLADLIYQFGEERLSRRIAKNIVAQRRLKPIRTAGQLAEIVRKCVPRSKNHSIDPATRTFQALRIAVNEELESLKLALKRIPDCLAPGGRLAIISFHSLEDRLVKQAFRSDERLNVLTKKPIIPTEDEIQENRRSRSSKLRVAERKSLPN